VIHGALLVAVQLQPLAAVTLTEPVVPAATALVDVGEIEGEQDAAAWLTVKVLLATVTVPVRGDAFGFAATEYATGPFPLPDAPGATVIQAALLVAVHVHPAAAVTLTLPEPPDPGTLVDPGEIVGAHEVPACVTVKVLPATVTVPVREDVLGFAATE
jgi:hypothetical protein